MAIAVGIGLAAGWYRVDVPQGMLRASGDALAERLAFRHDKLGQLYGMLGGFHVTLNIDFEAERMQVVVDGLPAAFTTADVEPMPATTRRMFRELGKNGSAVELSGGALRVTFSCPVTNGFVVESTLRACTAVAAQIVSPAVLPASDLYARALTAAEADEREYAFTVLGAEYAHTRLALRALSSAFRDESRDIRMGAAVFALGSTSEVLQARGRKALLEFTEGPAVAFMNALVTESPSQLLRERAVTALAVHGDISSFEPLIHFIRNNVRGPARASADEAYRRIQQRVGPVGAGAVALADVPAVDEGAVSVAAVGEVSLLPSREKMPGS